MAKRIVLDVAANASATDFASLARQGVRPETAILVFDFDGVLASNKEELVYQAAPQAGEDSRLEKLAKDFDIDPRLYDTKYLRHLVYQEMLHHLGVEVESGPLLHFAKELADTNIPYYILTARSSPAAIVRVFKFCKKHDLKPQEFFFVGRVGKGRQLHLVGTGAPNRRIIYFEDSLRHVRNSTSLSYDLLTTVHVVWDNHDASETGRRTFAQALKDWLDAGSGEDALERSKLSRRAGKGI